jgi:hypothetical protein
MLAPSAASKLAAALALAEDGLPLFPCRAHDEVANGRAYGAKSPLTKNGFHDATRDIDQITAWWERWADALIGVPTGDTSGIFVIDVDPRGASWYADNASRLNAGRVHRTRRGHHLLYEAAGFGCSTGTLADGVDTRGEGGYVIWWPAAGLKTVGDLEDVGELPEWVTTRLRDADAKKTERKSSDGGMGGDRSADLLRRVGLDVRSALADYEILARHRDHPHARDQTDPERAVQRCIDKCRSDTDKTAAGDAQDLPGSVRTADFYAYMPTHTYIFVPSRDLWPPSSVNARCHPPTNSDGTPATKRVKRKGKGDAEVWETVPMSATEWLDEHHPIDQMTWCPGEPMVIRDRLVSNGGWIERPGCAVFNLYMPPKPQEGDGDFRAVDPWLELIHTVYPSDAGHIMKWLAHRVQRPGDKINHALFLGGEQGIGKDTMLEPVKCAVGPWNFNEVSPSQALGRFNGFVKSVILRLSEARDLGEIDRFAFYDHTKVLTAAPPDVLRCDEKNIREHAVFNVCGVIITSNHKTDGIYLPADDRRHYVAWSDLKKSDFEPDYWTGLYRWYAGGGTGQVVAYLKNLDLTGFDPKAPPPKTAAFYDIVDANRAPEDSELADALDLLNDSRERNGKAIPAPAITLQDIITWAATDSFREWLQDRRNRRQIPHRLEAVGYVPVRNDADKRDGQWKVGGKRQTIYGRRDLSIRDRHIAAADLAREVRR